MTARKNNRVQKRALAYDGHNRKAGVSAGTKADRNKRARRRGAAGGRDLIRHYVPHVFKQ